jgi:hypothetical protein
VRIVKRPSAKVKARSGYFGGLPTDGPGR